MESSPDLALAPMDGPFMGLAAVSGFANSARLIADAIIVGAIPEGHEPEALVDLRRTLLTALGLANSLALREAADEPIPPPPEELGSAPAPTGCRDPRWFAEWMEGRAAQSAQGAAS